MLKQLTPPVRGLVLDMDGVLWKGPAPVGDLKRNFEVTRAAGLQVVLATNNATMTVDQYLEKLAGFGVTLEPWQVVTSAHGAVAMLQKDFPQKGAVYVIGENGIIRALSEAGFITVTEAEDDTPAVAVVAGMDRSFSYQKLQRAMAHIRNGARFYGTNPDVTFPTPAGLVPGAGAMIAAVQACTYTEPVIIGKPSPYLFRLCAERMQLEMKEILVVGDRLETDIAGGQGVGARSALVLSGVSTREQGEQWRPKPDIIAADLGALVGA